MKTAWFAESERRAHEKLWGQLRLRLVDETGSPLAGQRMCYHQRTSPFRIGSCIGGRLLGVDAFGELLRSTMRSWFSLAVCENAMKWYVTERDDGAEDYSAADALLAWCEREGIPMRGHCLFWDKEKFAVDWVRALDGRQLQRRMEQRLVSILERYRGRVRDWDALNEIMDGGFTASRMGVDGPAWIFRQAHAIDPTLRLFTNEYGILDSDERCERYYQQIADLLAAGAPVGGIGIQEHAAERFVPDHQQARLAADRPERQGRGPLIPEEVWRRLDRLASLGLPIHVGEISIATPHRAQAADCLEMMLRTLRAHPMVENAIFWGFQARNHWLGDVAALMDERGRPYPAMSRLAALEQEWESHGSCTSDGQGQVAFSAWAGDYEISISDDAALRRATICLPPGSGPAAQQDLQVVCMPLVSSAVS